MHEQFDLVIVTEETRKPAGVSIAVAVSLLVHGLMLYLLIVAYNNRIPPATEEAPLARYVQLIRQQPKQFIEAPGPEVAQAPLTAPLSDKNRKASMPEPTGTQPTARPGDGSEIYTPAMGSSRESQQPQRAAQAPQHAQQPSPQFAGRPTDSPLQQAAVDSQTFAFREPVAAAAASAAVDWRQAIRSVKPSAGGSSGFDTSGISGGQQGTAEQGPLSFETQWFDWGPYAQSMVSRIRVNWYANMPQLIRTGIAGVVTIRFTIQRDGRITDVTVLESSSHPPYDFAARKAIELSSPLNPLPANFPNPNERVTAKFFYNKPIS